MTLAHDITTVRTCGDWCLVKRVESGAIGGL